METATCTSATRPMRRSARSLQAGVVTTLAGTVGTGGSQDGTGAAATFSSPAGIGVDSNGNIYVADQTDDTIRKVTSTGVVTTIAGTIGAAGFTDGAGSIARFNSPYGIAVDKNGNVYIADTGNRTVREMTPAGLVSTIAGTAKVAGTANGTGAAARFEAPVDLGVDSNGNVFVADQGSDQTIREITPAGVVTTFAGNTGHAGFVNGTGTAAEFDAPFGVAVDSNGNVYVGDTGNDTIRKITSVGAVTTLAGTPGSGYANGTGSAARFDQPTGTAVDGNGNVYVADEENDMIRKITPGGVVTTLAGSPGNGGSADGTGSAAQFYFPFGVAVDGAGNVFVTDTGNDTIRKITPGGAVTTVAGTPLTAGSTDGTGSAALFSVPIGIAVDGNDNLYVTEQENQTIRKITSAGVVTTLAGQAGSPGSADGTGSAARFDLPGGITLAPNGNLFVADTTNAEIREVTPAGVVTTIAGMPANSGAIDGTGSAARFFFPVGIASDGHGNLFVADANNDLMREVTEAGVVTTLGGTPAIFGSTDGTGSSALFDNPEGIAADANGNVYVGDTGNGTIRRGTLSGAPQIISQPLSVVYLGRRQRQLLGVSGWRLRALLPVEFQWIGDFWRDGIDLHGVRCADREWRDLHGDDHRHRWLDHEPQRDPDRQHGSGDHETDKYINPCGGRHRRQHPHPGICRHRSRHRDPLDSRRWPGPVGVWRRRRPGPADAERLQRLNRHRLEHGLGHECKSRPDRQHGGPGRCVCPPGEQRRLRRDREPHGRQLHRAGLRRERQHRGGPRRSLRGLVDGHAPRKHLHPGECGNGREYPHPRLCDQRTWHRAAARAG